MDYSRLILSKGKLPELNSPLAFLSAPDTLRLNWLASESDKTSYNDQLMLVVLCSSVRLSDGFIGAALRRDLHCYFKLDPKQMRESLEVYVSLTSFNRRKIANSIYLGRIEPG